MKTDTPRPSSRASLSITCPAVFRVRIFFCRIQLSSRSMFSYWALHSFCLRPLVLIDRSLRNNTDSLDFRIVKAQRHTPGARRLSILSVRQKSEIPIACSVPPRPHLPPILWRSGVGNRSCSKSAKLMLANGLISHPRSFYFIFFISIPISGSKDGPP